MFRNMNHIILGHNIESSIRARFARPSWNRGYGGCIPLSLRSPIVEQGVWGMYPPPINQYHTHFSISNPSIGGYIPLKPLPKRPYLRFSQSIQNIFYSTVDTSLGLAALAHGTMELSPNTNYIWTILQNK